MKVFSNEPLTSLDDPKHRQTMTDALASVGSELGRSYPLVIGGQVVATARTLPSVNPCQHDQVVGLVAQAGREQAEQAMEAAWRAFADWRRVPAEGRAACLFKLAGVMRRRKAELTAWLVFEAAKNWREADADVAEAIDFCEYYGREMLRYDSSDNVCPLDGEDNHQRYVPTGVGIIISPWNFPLAILTGMSMAAAVAGNTVIIKPANTAGVIAAKLMEMVAEAGFPAGVVNYLPGSGADIGEYLIQHPRTRFISFTGSKDVGLHINETTAHTQPGQKWIKRVVAEMGGKDCIIVDETADLDAAAQSIVKSAFGFQGQKCSACSRAIVVDSVYDAVLERVAAGAAKLSQGAATDNSDVCAVIDDKAYASIMKYIAIGATEGRIAIGGHGSNEHGYPFLRHCGRAKGQTMAGSPKSEQPH